jgi:hypothetical protein
MNPQPDGKRLFKYRPLLTSDGEVDQWTESIFRARELWFAAPKDFNDPFDCNLLLNAEGTDDEKVAYLLSVSDQGEIPELEHFLKYSGRKPWEGDPSFFERPAASERKKIYEESSVFCWSAIGNNVLMFSHYADSHRGICLEFEATSNDDIGKVELVNYKPELPELNYLKLYKDRQRLTESLILTKESQWDYEKEWRVFRYGQRNGHVGFKDHHLKRIILGCAGSADVRKQRQRKEAVIKLLADWKTPVILAQAEPSKSSFRLEIRDFEIIHG